MCSKHIQLGLLFKGLIIILDQQFSLIAYPAQTSFSLNELPSHLDPKG